MERLELPRGKRVRSGVALLLLLMLCAEGEAVGGRWVVLEPHGEDRKSVV